MFDANVSALIAKYRRKGILLDTNLLLLMVVGSYAPPRIASFKRTRVYSLEDFQLLHGLVSQFETRWTTPNILTEVDNLARQLPSAEHQALSLAAHQIASVTNETSRRSSYVMALPSYAKFGLSDSVSILLAEECLVVSDDLPLCHYITGTGRDALNFNHLRL